MFHKLNNMKKNISAIVVSIIFSLICFQLKSQDLIVKAKGDTIKGKVLEVGTKTISYKKASHPDGPTIVIEKKDVLFIKYSNGEMQDFLDESAAQVPDKDNKDVKNA